MILDKPKLCSAEWALRVAEDALYLAGTRLTNDPAQQGRVEAAIDNVQEALMALNGGRYTR